MALGDVVPQNTARESEVGCGSEGQVRYSHSIWHTAGLVKNYYICKVCFLAGFNKLVCSVTTTVYRL